MRVSSIQFLVLPLVGLLWGQLAWADYSWIESETAPDQVTNVYGTEEQSITLAEANVLLLELANEARRLVSARELKPHGLASWLSQDHAEEMVSHRYLNHHDLEGRKVEMRFNRLGQADHVTENVVYSEISCTIFLTRQLVSRLHEYWITSESHLANILDPAHTHLGSGFSVQRENGVTVIAGVAVFVNDYGDYERLPVAASPGEVLRLEGHIDPREATLQYVGLGSEDLPFARDPDYQLENMGPYSQPKVSYAFLPKQYLGRYEPDVDELRYTVDFREEDGSFALEIRLAAGIPVAALYVTVWVKDNTGPPEAFPAMTQVVLVE